jgi:hypothetical protein
MAHCLELDIVTTGETQSQVKQDMVDLISSQIDYAFSNDNLAHLYHPAPLDVWKEFYECEGTSAKRYTLKGTLKGKSRPESFVPPWIAEACLIAPSRHV